MSRRVDNIEVIGGEGQDSMEWIDMALVRERRRAIVNTVTNFQVPKKLTVS
jgi:hypothetical protein